MIPKQKPKNLASEITCTRQDEYVRIDIKDKASRNLMLHIEMTTDDFYKALSKNELLPDLVRSFYKRKFWDRLSLDGINNQGLCNEIFDISVNMGVYLLKVNYKNNYKVFKIVIKE